MTPSSFPCRSVARLASFVVVLTASALSAPVGWHYLSLPLSGKVNGDLFGYSVANAGDVNGDGYDDAIIGAPGPGVGSAYVGRAYLYFGGPVPDSTADVTFFGTASGDRFALEVAGAGDVNGDGYADVIIGAPYNDAGGTNAGRWYLYFGGASVDNVADVTRNGTANSWLGYSVAGAGDVNADGYDDIVVGAYIVDRTYIYYGGASMNNVADVTLVDEYLGPHVAGAGDVNGDGYDDVLAAANGWVNLYFGGSPMDPAEDRTFFIDSFQCEVAGAGDVNGDGYADIILGEASVPTTGRAYIFHGGANMDLIPDVILAQGGTNDWFGESVAGGGNLNGDAYSDVLVSSLIGTATQTPAFVFHGGSPMNTVKDRTISGRDVSGLGNWNGDSRSDFITGTPGYVSGTGGPGTAIIYYSKYYPGGLSPARAVERIKLPDTHISVYRQP